MKKLFNAVEQQRNRICPYCNSSDKLDDGDMLYRCNLCGKQFPKDEPLNSIQPQKNLKITCLSCDEVEMLEGDGIGCVERCKSCEKCFEAAQKSNGKLTIICIECGKIERQKFGPGTGGKFKVYNQRCTECVSIAFTYWDSII